MSTVIDKQINRKLDVQEILAWLEQDGMVKSDSAHLLRTLAGGVAYKNKHPLEVIASRRWVNELNQKPLSLEGLTQWFANRPPRAPHPVRVHPSL